MTIVASIKISEGLALGTDSLSQIQGQDSAGNVGIIKIFSNARKLFQFKDWPIGILSYGIGNLGKQSVQAIIIDFESKYKGSQIVEDVTKGLFCYIENISTDKKLKTGLGFIVVGYSPKQSLPDEWEFLYPRDSQPKQVRPREQFGASWRGVDVPFTRLYKGYDPRMITELQKLGLSDDDINQAVMQSELPVVYDGMPVQDAIDFATFIFNTTIGISKFELGFPYCGGPLQLATILPKSGFQWVTPAKIIARESQNDA